MIETEKYIGIILQCATGGELFDYILAHRYLKEKDASRLFAQLISGVHYMHQKQIVHRDLKLENLLLDRHRNVLITDFGFANQFSSSVDDLMATSCGSPCYAAPELVMNQGLYVGTAVDIWSCGVILFAMLCGYLPFDDDPENPESDNINLLYKYILNTPLIFPDYISQEACDLMRLMLVPDPIKRCDMETIMDHPWLENHRHLFKSLDTQVTETSIADNPQTTSLENIPHQNDVIEESTENLSNQVGQEEKQEDQEDQEQEATTEDDGESEEVTDQVEPAEPPSSISQFKDDQNDTSIEDPVETIPVNEKETSQENVPDMNTLPLEEPVETTIEIKNNHDQHTTQELKSVTTTMDDDNSANNTNSDQDEDVSILESVQFNNTSSINDAITEPDTPKPSIRVDNKRSSAESKHSDHFLSGHIDTPPPRSTKHMSLEGSILQAKFLSSVQRKDSKQRKQMTPPPSPRRKTLSLLVNSIDHKFTKSQRTPMMPSVSEHTSLSEKEKRSTGKKFIDWFKKKPLSK